MRDKEALENERKNLGRNGEKQSKLIEKVMEEKSNLHQQIVSPSLDFIDFIHSRLITLHIVVRFREGD